MFGIKVVLPTIVFCVWSCGWAECVSDEEIATRIVLANSYVDDWRAAARDMRSAIELCGSDSNRLCQIVRGIAETNTDVRHVGTAMRMLTRYGSSAQLPYLYSVSTNEIRGAQAVKAILRIEGVTTNSILAVSNCLAHAEIDIYERYKAFYDFIERVYRLAPNNPNRYSGIAYINSYVRNENMGCEGIDKLLIKVDPAYRWSKRRLADLRSAVNRGVHEYQIRYITNAINELVAYPEANLPE